MALIIEKLKVCITEAPPQKCILMSGGTLINSYLDWTKRRFGRQNYVIYTISAIQKVAVIHSQVLCLHNQRFLEGRWVAMERQQNITEYIHKSMQTN